MDNRGVTNIKPNPTAGAFAPTNYEQVSTYPYLGQCFEVKHQECRRTCAGSRKGTASGGCWQPHCRGAGRRSIANLGEQEPFGVTVATPLHSQKVLLCTEYTPPHLRPKRDPVAVGMASYQKAVNESAYSQNLTRSDDKSRRVSSGVPPTIVSASPMDANNPLVTDGTVDDPTTNRSLLVAVQRELTSPLSPKSALVQTSTSMGRLCLASNESVASFKPRFIAELSQLSEATRSKIPPEPVTFAPDFLRNNLGGILWSPGYVFVPPSQMSILPGRAYFMVDPAHDPHLPSGPGQHGAKLVPFFNMAPEDNDAFNLPDDFNSSVDVPLFVLRDITDNSGKIRKHYVYYGHYTQSRWSDKLDHDHMAACVPPSVREFWARELSAVGRPEWVTNALQKQFFPSPEYTGTLPGYLEDEGGSVKDGDFATREEIVAKDLKRYLEKLRMWKKEADMRTSMIREDFILAAFDKVLYLRLITRIGHDLSDYRANVKKADADGHKAL